MEIKRTRIVRDADNRIVEAITETEPIPSFKADDGRETAIVPGMKFLVSLGPEEEDITLTHPKPFDSLAEAEAHIRGLERAAADKGLALAEVVLSAVPPDVQIQIKTPTKAIGTLEVPSPNGRNGQHHVGFQGSNTPGF
jgi:hypothetical protein